MLKIWRHLVTLWEQGQGNTVLYEYTEFLRNDSIAFLGLEHELDVSFFVDRARTAAAAAAAGPPSPAAGSSPPRSLNRRASVEQLRARYRLTLPASASVHRLLETHQRQAEAAEFGRRRFPCKVCGEERAGSDCVRLTRCGHVYCRDCLTAYYTVLIRDGEVQNLRCPEDQCPEQATPKEVRDLVGDDLFERYDTILLRTSLSAMTDVVTCPRAHCQKPVVLDPGDSLGRCAHCDHTFCAICQNAYHGNNPCAVKSGQYARHWWTNLLEVSAWSWCASTGWPVPASAPTWSGATAAGSCSDWSRRSTRPPGCQTTASAVRAAARRSRKSTAATRCRAQNAAHCSAGSATRACRERTRTRTSTYRAASASTSCLRVWWTAHCWTRNWARWPSTSWVRRKTCPWASSCELETKGCLVVT
ncbi:E3 ubiquitin-protein ligase RNF14-like isoform X3 [Amphibalanus amphitrite]|nr:E3 ubiquitin-protein ligase RNF14-like isoform X3 [Amphibalanus amphitrite]